MPNNTDILSRARALLEGITPGEEWEAVRRTIFVRDSECEEVAQVASFHVDKRDGRAAFIAAAPSLVRELCDALGVAPEVAEEGLAAAYMMGGVDKGRLLREAEARLRLVNACPGGMERLQNITRA